MKSVLPPIWMVTSLLLSGCAPEGAPFPSSFKITGPGQFEFVASGNWVYPANTTAGEAERMSWLDEYISKHQICPFGYTIVERTPKGASGSARSSIVEQLLGSIRYVGRCKSAPRPRTVLQLRKMPAIGEESFVGDEPRLSIRPPVSVPLAIVIAYGTVMAGERFDYG
jgi:hypothetical protein